jgi:amino acid transporter
MGCGRSLYQAAEDGLLPRFFQHKNRHGVPDYAMGFNVVCSMILVLLGSPLRIYIISNGGYLLSCSLALLGYFVYRQLRPDTPRPFRLPTWMKWLALAVFIVWAAIYFFGGWNSPKIVLADPRQGPGLYLLGLLIVALYAPLYWWRRGQDRRLAAKDQLLETVPAAAGLAAGDGSVADPVGGAEPSPGEPPTAR